MDDKRGGVTMRTAICDDNRIEITGIEDYLLGQGDGVDFYESGEALLAAYEKQGLRYDVLFLDLELSGEMQGFDVANAVKAMDDKALVIFVTSHHQYVFDCFQCSPVWFLRKPVQPDELEQAYRHALHLLAQRRRTFTFSDSRQSLRLKSEDILYFESQSHNVRIHTTQGDAFSIRTTMKALEEQLGEGFCRIHAAYIINLQHVTKIANEERQKMVWLKDADQPLPVSRRYQEALTAAFLQFKEKEFLE